MKANRTAIEGNASCGVTGVPFLRGESAKMVLVMKKETSYSRETVDYMYSPISFFMDVAIRKDNKIIALNVMPVERTYLSKLRAIEPSLYFIANEMKVVFNIGDIGRERIHVFLIKNAIFNKLVDNSEVWSDPISCDVSLVSKRIETCMEETGTFYFDNLSADNNLHLLLRELIIERALIGNSNRDFDKLAKDIVTLNKVKNSLYGIGKGLNPDYTGYGREFEEERLIYTRSIFREAEKMITKMLTEVNHHGV